MKKLVFISSLFVAMTLVFVSCGGNDGPAPTPVQKIIKTTWTFSVKGFAGSSVTLPEAKINLSDVPGIDANNFISGEFQSYDNTIQVSGLKNMAGVVLNNFTIQINSITPINNFGTVTATPGPNDFGSDEPQGGDKVTSFAKSLFTAYTGKDKTATLKVTFTPNKDIVASDNVSLIITVNGKYNWNTYNQ